MHSFQFMADLSEHRVIDGDAIHIVCQVKTGLVNAAAWAVGPPAYRNLLEAEPAVARCAGAGSALAAVQRPWA